MKKRFSLVVFAAAMAAAQTPSSNFIKNSGQYYWGEGEARDYAQARDIAAKELSGQIAVKVSSVFERKVRETGRDLAETVESVLQSHTQATLHNLHYHRSAGSEGKVKVFCWLSRDEVESVFNVRRKLIADIYEKSRAALSQADPGFALKHLYFACLLLNSLPDERTEYEGVNYTLEIPALINSVLQKIEICYLSERRISEKEREITLSVSYGGKPAAQLAFTFWDGVTWGNEVQARDGLATVTLLGSSTGFDELKANVKYEFYESRKEFQAVDALWDYVTHPEYQSNKTVLLKKVGAPGKAEPSESLRQSVFHEADEASYELRTRGSADAPRQRIETEAGRFVEALRNGTEAVRGSYADDPFLCNKLTRYISENRPRPLDRDIGMDLERTRNGWEGRRIRVLHSFPSISKECTEYLILDFDQSGKLVDFNLGVVENLYEQYVKGWSDSTGRLNRQEIVKFLEKYRTAYMTRDLPTIDLMFAENALIIVGRRIEKKNLPENAVSYQPVGNQPAYEYLQMKKQDFIKRQKQVFDANEDISLDFSTFRIVEKNKTPNVYGVEMRQSYASTHYADEGYLFLLVDFNEEDPMIYVRAWQPNSWSEDELIKTANFRVYR